MIDYRIRSIFIGTTCFFVLILARLTLLQIKHASHFFTLSQKNFIRFEHIESYRGNIVDTQGILLATNRPVISIYWQGTGKRKLTPEQENTLQLLSVILQDDELDCARNHLLFAEQNKRRVLLAADISHEQLSQIMEQLPHNPNIVINTAAERYYPHGTLACHMLGYLGNIDAKGNMGLEKALDDKLRGYQGTKMATVNSRGSTIQEKELAPPVHGVTIRSTLNLDIQRMIEQVFPEQYTGCFIVMEPTTGAIRGLVSRPHFDPNLFLHRLSHDEWKQIQERQPFINRALGSCFPPASIFKLVTITAALEEGFITPDISICCNGSTLYGNRHFHCHIRTGHGRLSVKEAVAKSCNILFFEIAKKMPIDTLAHYANLFGLGVKTNCLLPECTGLIPTTAWKRSVKKEPWWPGETLSVVIGQGYLLIPPIQIVRMIAGIFTGYLVKPRILEDEPIQINPIDVKKDTLLFLQQSMKRAVEEGTARTKKIADIDLYAKTGTAQTTNFIGTTEESLLPCHAWFVGTFWYKEKPLTIMILVEYAGSSKVAKRVAEQFLTKYRAFYKNDPNF